MPRYYFNLCNGFFTADNRGSVFATRKDAAVHASHVAAEYARHRANIDRDLCVSVTDELGTEVFRTPVIGHLGKTEWP